MDNFHIAILVVCLIVGVIIAPGLIPLAFVLWLGSKAVQWGIDRWL